MAKMSKTSKRVATDLRVCRVNAGLSRAELAALLEVSPATVSNLENGTYEKTRNMKAVRNFIAKQKEKASHRGNGKSDGLAPSPVQLRFGQSVVHPKDLETRIATDASIVCPYCFRHVRTAVIATAINGEVTS